MSEMLISNLAQRLATVDKPKVMRFSLCQGMGWITTGSEESVKLLCDIWNNRALLAAALVDPR